MVSNWLLDWWKCCVDDNQITSLSPPPLYLFCAKKVYSSSCDPYYRSEVGLLDTSSHTVPQPIPLGLGLPLLKRSNTVYVTQLSFMQMFNALRETPGAKAANLRLVVKSNHQIKDLPLPEVIKKYLEIDHHQVRTHWYCSDLKYFAPPHDDRDLVISAVFKTGYCPNYPQTTAVLTSLAAQKPGLDWQRNESYSFHRGTVTYLG